MLKKLTNKKGFTLMEMLIVVAIIAVLVAIAIPTFNGALTKSKEAADVANIRAAYAEYQVKAIDGDTTAAWDDTGVQADMNFKAADHGYSYTAGTKTITYKATKLEGGKTYTWELGDIAD